MSLEDDLALAINNELCRQIDDGEKTDTLNVTSKLVALPMVQGLLTVLDVSEEKFVTHHPDDNSVSLDPYAGLSREQLKKLCYELSRALTDWQFAAMSAAQDSGNNLENVREPYRSKIRELIEAYED